VATKEKISHNDKIVRFWKNIERKRLRVH